MPRAVRSRDASDMAATDPKVFRALADGTRRRILHLLGDRELAAGEIAEAFPQSRPAISKHLRILREAGLVTSRAVGRERRYAIVPGPLREAAAQVQALDAFWKEGLGRLGEHLRGGR